MKTIELKFTERELEHIIEIVWAANDLGEPDLEDMELLTKARKALNKLNEKPV